MMKVVRQEAGVVYIKVERVKPFQSYSPDCHERIHRNSYDKKELGKPL